VRRLLALLVALLLLTACGPATGRSLGGAPAASPPSTSGAPGSPSSPSAPASSSSIAPSQAHDPYVRLADTLHRRGVDIWFETDLVAAWLAGPTAFQTTLTRLGRLAHVPGVVGFKIADEMGYHDGLETPDQTMAFLQAAHEGLARVAPGKQLLVDMVVPDLGCLPWRGGASATCGSTADASYPAAGPEAVTRYLHTGWIDRLDLSTGLLDPTTYAGWGLSLKEAQADAWSHVVSWGWPGLTVLQSRKALAQPGGFQGSASEASDDLDVYVTTPTDAGARAVDIWTWRQPYDGATVSLLPDSLTPNSLWQGLLQQHTDGVQLVTHMTPSAMPTDPTAFAHECDVAATVFSAVFVAAGTG
jgi:hypothetical protein